MIPTDIADFSNDFYTGRWEGSFARGVPFHSNPSTGDLRICGTLASLVGVEDAISQQNTLYEDMALRRARMLMGVLMSVGGIPLLYMGEELGILNDYSYLSNPDQLEDSRWVHRVAMDWDMVPGSCHKHGAIQAAFTSMFQELVEARKKQTVLAGTQIQVLDFWTTACWCSDGHRMKRAWSSSRTSPNNLIRLTPDFFGLSGVRGPLKDVLNNSALESQSYIEAYGLHWCQEGTDLIHFERLERMYANAPINDYFAPDLTVEEGRAELRIQVRDDFHHAAGAMHGVVYFKALDDATYFAANSIVTDVFVLTANLKSSSPQTGVIGTNPRRGGRHSKQWASD